MRSPHSRRLAGAVWLAGVNAWGGNAEEIIGDRTNGFAQLGLVSAVGGQIALGEYGRLDGRLSGVITTTQLGLDFAGSNFYDGETRSPSAMTLEDFYVRWNSGALVPRPSARMRSSSPSAPSPIRAAPAIWARASSSGRAERAGAVAAVST